MRFTRLRRQSSLQKGQIDIAPLIDVVFLLLIFFMLTSHFILQPGITVQLPRAVTSEVIEPENIVIVVTAQDLVYLDEKPAQWGALSDILKDAGRLNRSVLIKADTGSSLGRIVELWDLCRNYGVSRVNIATNQKRFGA